MAFLVGSLPKNEERNLANIIRYAYKAALKYDNVSWILKQRIRQRLKQTHKNFNSTPEPDKTREIINTAIRARLNVKMQFEQLKNTKVSG